MGIKKKVHPTAFVKHHNQNNFDRKADLESWWVGVRDWRQIRKTQEENASRFTISWILELTGLTRRCRVYYPRLRVKYNS